MPANIQALENLKAQGFDLLEEHPEQLPPAYRDWIETGLRMSVSDRLRDQRARTAVYDAFQAVFAEYDLLVTPTVPAMPVPNGEADGTTLGPTEIDGTPVDPLIGWGMAYMINFTGHPAASVPAGMHEGLPVGLQIVGGRYRDEDVIAASAAFERHRPWFDAYAAIEE